MMIPLKERNADLRIFCRSILLLFFIASGLLLLNPKSYAIQESPKPIVELSEAEIADADSGNQSDYFTIDSTPDDVRRLQGEPDSMFDDGRRKVWYYGKDAVYFNYYGRVMDADNNSGKLKFR